MMRKIRAGFLGFGEVNSPKEFIGRMYEDAKQRLSGAGFELSACALVSDDPEGRDVERAIQALAHKDMDLLVICILGWIPTHAVIDVILHYKNTPMVLWGLCGSTQNGRLVTTAAQAGTTALRKIMEEMDFRFKFIYESVDAPARLDSILSYGRAARAAGLLRGAKAGMMGHRDMRLYGTVIDATLIKSIIGAEIENFEMLEIVQRVENIKQSDIDAVKADILGTWVIQGTPENGLLDKNIAFYLALRDKIRERGYDAISLIDVDGMKKLLFQPPSMIFMLLTDTLGVSAVPENDEPGLITQLMVRNLTGQIAAYFEFYEFMKDRVLAGVPDFIPREVTDGDVTVRPLCFGSFAQSILNVSKAKQGRVTLFRLIKKDGGLAMHMATGEATTPRPWEEAGWSDPAPQLPSLEFILDGGVERFAQQVAAQHYFIAYGDHVEAMRDLCSILSIEVIYDV